jgi:hypothetical protein
MDKGCRLYLLNHAFILIHLPYIAKSSGGVTAGHSQDNSKNGENMKLYRLVTAAVLIALLVGTASLPAAAEQVDVTGKVENLVLEEITANGQTDFFIWMTDKADLSPASQLHTKLEKGIFVYTALRETAERSQKDLRRYLDAQGVRYEAFYIANKILVRGGSQLLLDSLAARPDVAQVTANHKFQLQEPFKSSDVQNTPTGIETNITFIKAPDVWAMGYTGQGTVMAGNDTGLAWDHPAVINHYRGWDGVTANHNYNWWDATGTYPTVPGDGHGHGTHTTGTMVGDDGGANQIGVAPGARTVHCKNMTDGGSGDDATFTTCFQWDLAPWDLSGLNPNPAMAPNAINNSWGYWGGNSPQFKDEIQALHAAGILVEVSAGNEGSSCTTLRSPGDYWEVLTTGSVNHATAFPGSMTSFSSRGPSLIDGNYFPDITAPGENIRSSLPGNIYESWSGTSMAGPHATALVGLMWSACPSLQGQVYQTIDIIHQTAVPVNYVGACGGDYVNGPNNDWGFGTIDALAAVQQAVAQCTGVGTLQGTVTDSSNNLPVAGASILAQWSGGGTWNATTDANGFYQITLPIGQYDVTADAFAFLSQTANTVVLTDTITVQDFALVPAPTFTVSGLVKDANTNAPLSAQVEVLDTPLAPVMTNPATGFYSIIVPEGTYTFRASAALHQTQQAELLVDGNKTLDFLLAESCILLVDDDNNAPNVAPSFAAALDTLGVVYNTFDVGGAGGNGPSLSELQSYRMVFWFSGDKFGSSAGPNTSDETNLAAYLDGGGRLFLSSQDYLYDFGLTSFGQNYLGIGTYANDTGNATGITGQAGDPIGDGLGPFSLTYPGDFTDYGDVVSAGTGASVAFKASNNTNNLNIDKSSGAWKTVFFGTDWQPVYNNNAANGAAVLQRIVDFFDGCQAPPPQNTVHVDTIQLRYVDLGSGRYAVQSTLRVRDQDGQLVPSAVVSSEWTLPNDVIRAQNATTNTQGVARFRLTTRLTGQFEFCVTNVVIDGFVYDPGQNGETCDIITVP